MEEERTEPPAVGVEGGNERTQSISGHPSDDNKDTLCTSLSETNSGVTNPVSNRFHLAGGEPT